MSKPGHLHLFDSPPMDIDEFEQEAIDSVKGFCKNMRNLYQSEEYIRKHGVNSLTFFEWYYTFGYWNESMEFLDEFPEFIPDNLMTL